MDRPANTTSNERAAVVTGAAGLLGSRVVANLADAGIRVYAVVRTVHDVDVCGLRTAAVDVIAWDDLLKMKAADLPQKPDVFVHLGWHGVGADAKDNLSVQLDNIDLTLAAVQCADNLEACRFLTAGSTLELVSDVQKGYSTVPVNAYIAAKQACRSLGMVLAAQLGIQFIYAYISSAYAPERNDGNVIWYVATELLAGRKPKLSGMEQTWDFIHADDAALALALVAMSPNVSGEYEIASGTPHKLADYILYLRDLIDPNLPLGIGEAPTNRYAPSINPDITRLVNDTGFVPRIPFDKGMIELISTLRGARSWNA